MADALAFNSLFLPYYMFYLLTSANQGSPSKLKIDFVQFLQENLSSFFTILPILNAALTQQTGSALHFQVRVVTLTDESATLPPPNAPHKSQQAVPVGRACGAYDVSYAC